MLCASHFQWVLESLRVWDSLGQADCMPSSCFLHRPLPAGARLPSADRAQTIRPILHRTNETETRLGARACSVAMRFRKGFGKRCCLFRAPRALHLVQIKPEPIEYSLRPPNDLHQSLYSGPRAFIQTEARGLDFYFTFCASAPPDDIPHGTKNSTQTGANRFFRSTFCA